MCNREELCIKTFPTETYFFLAKAPMDGEQFAEEQLYGSRPVGAIFALKNRGWKDKSEIDLNSNNFNMNIDYSNLTEEEGEEEAKKLFKKKLEEMKNGN